MDQPNSELPGTHNAAGLTDHALMKSKDRLADFWTAYAAALWALIFARFHVVWATGWYVGLDAEQSRIAFSKPPFLVYDLMVAGMCAVAVPVALAVTMPWGHRVPRRLLGMVAWGGSGLLDLSFLASVA